MTPVNPIPKMWEPFIREGIAKGIREPLALVEYASSRVRKLCEFAIGESDAAKALRRGISDVTWLQINAENVAANLGR